MVNILRQRRLLLSIGLLAAMLIAILTAGYIYAQNEGSGNIYSDKEGDERIVPVVNGINVSFGDVRKSPDFWQDRNSELTEEEAFKLAIVGDIDRFILLSEVKKRGLVATESEGLDFMAPHREACAREQACQDLIAAQGETVESYWDRVASSFREDLGITRLNAALLSDKGLEPGAGTNDERSDALDEAVDQLRSDAKIEWSDDDLAEYYREALSARSG